MKISFPTKLFEGKPSIFEYLQEQAFGEVATMNWHHEHGSLGVVEDQMGACLADFSISLLFEEAKKLGSFRHLIYGQSDRFSVNSARGGNRLALLATLFDVEAHRFENAALCFLDRFPEAVYAREIVAIGVVLLALFLNRDRIAIKGHLALC
jgi:hypothetical protein